MGEKVKLAMMLATAEHVDKNNQKYGILPYTHHLQAVANVLVRFGFTDEKYIASAWLHDCPEDTGYKIRNIREIFGDEVADIVQAVTDEPGENRKARKAATYPKIRANPDALIVKLADRIANVENSGDAVNMYRKEYEDFRRNLYTEGQECSGMWKHLDGLITGTTDPKFWSK